MNLRKFCRHGKALLFTANEACGKGKLTFVAFIKPVNFYKVQTWAGAIGAGLFFIPCITACKKTAVDPVSLVNAGPHHHYAAQDDI